MPELSYDVKLVQDPDFWFLDGNIVLLAENTAYRVHRGVLSRQSEFFRDLFALPQPTDDESAFGCPVVHLHDSPINLRYLLRILYDGHSHSVKYMADIPFTELEALIRLAHKYEIEFIREDCLTRLKTLFTDDFTVHSAFAITASEALHMQLPDAISMVNLIHLIGENSMLPFALYSCAKVPADELMAGVSRVDGTFDRLSPDDLAKCINVKPLLAHTSAMSYLRVYSAASSECSRKPLCANAIQKTLVSLTETLSMSCYPLLCRDDHIDQICKWGSICDKCSQMLKAKHLECRRQIWEELPSYFGLGEWSQLRKQETP